MIRTFGLQTLGATAQPWFSDTLTAAIAAQPDNVNNAQAVTPVTVANTAKYRVGDYVVLGAGTATQERVAVTQIPSATVLNVAGCFRSHANGDRIALDIFCANVTIQLVDGGTGPAYLGTDNTVTAVPAGNAFYKLQKAAAAGVISVWNYSNSGGWSNLNSGDGWIVGTAGDTYLAAAYVV